MFPKEVILTAEEEALVFRIRQLIGDEKRVVVDDLYDVTQCGRVKVQGSMYGLEEPKGYPLEVLVSGITVTSGVEVLGYEYLQWETIPGPLSSDTSLSVVYEKFRHSDLEIINTYDTGATTYLVAQCNLSPEDLTQDLLVLSTAYALLSKDLSIYVSEAVNLEDSDSKFDASRRPQSLISLMRMIQGQLKDGIEAKTHCKMMSLPVYKVE
jgi:hypothetical protein